MEYALNVSTDAVELVLDEDVTVESAQALHSALLDPQGAVSQLVVNMSGVENIDITFLQLICSAHRAAIKEGRNIKLANLSPAIRKVIETHGFIRHVGCRDDASGSCLWILRNII